MRASSGRSGVMHNAPGRRGEPKMNASNQVNAATLAAPMPPSRAKRRTEVADALSQVLPPAAILFRHEDTAPYECDALTAYRTSPLVVALPETETQVAA